MSAGNRYQSIFRAANFLGLFPVSGLFGSSKKPKNGEEAERSHVEEIEFRPASWRLLATFVFIVAVLFLEGMGIIHMLISTDRSYTDSHVDFVTYRHGTITSDLAPVLHYGVTVAAVILLINASRRFPKTALLWQEAEEAAENVKIFSMKSIRDVQDTGHSGTCPSLGSVLIVFCIIFAAIIQTTIGTLTTVVINSQVNSSTTSDNGNELDAVQNWFQKYLLGSHSFVSALTDGETFWSGLAIFVVSNYTVIVWVIIDLILILSARNISLSSAQLNNEIDLSLDATTRSTDDGEPTNSASVVYIRQRHWNICQLVHHLDESISGLFLCFFVVNLFFMWNHLISLASPGIDLYLYTIYQAWSLFRQILRFGLVTSYAVSVSKQLKKPLRKVMGLSNKFYDQEARRLQEQSSLTYNGFNAGPFLRLDEKTIKVGILVLVVAFWMMFQFQKQHLEMSNTAIIMMKHNNKDIPKIDSESEGVNINTGKPSFEFQLIKRPGINYLQSDEGSELEKTMEEQQLWRPSNLNIFQW